MRDLSYGYSNSRIPATNPHQKNSQTNGAALNCIQNPHRTSVCQETEKIKYWKLFLYLDSGRFSSK